MSHFSVLVINTKGENDVDEQLHPYEEQVDEGDPRAVFVDTLQEYKEEFETKTRSEFYCNSSSSWGFQLKKEEREKLSKLKEGDHTIIDIGNEPFSYIKLNDKYGTYEMQIKEGDERETPIFDQRYWWEAVDIVEDNGNHPDGDICFKGKIRVRKLTPPREIPLKEYYNSFEDYCQDWHGSEPNEDGKHGYYENPNAKWDWHTVGGRWAGKLILKKDLNSNDTPNFSYGWDEDEKNKLCDGKHVDSARKGDIDWDLLTTGSVEDHHKHTRFWELIVEDQKPVDEKEEEIIKFNFYNPEYYLNKYKTKETYVKAMLSFYTYAAVIDGKWISAGEMGMFGVSHEDEDEKVNFEINFFDKIIKPLSDDAMITVVDCHI